MSNQIAKNVKKNPKVTILTVLILSTLILAFIGASLRQNWILVLILLFIAVLLFIPKFIENYFDIHIPLRIKVFTMLFIYGTLFLGELNNYYVKYWWWDIVLHTSSGLIFGIIGFLILYLLYRREKIKASPKVVAMFSFAFALAIGALWEIVEFTIDQIFGTRMQGGNITDGLTDTMYDLIVDSVGALFSAGMAYLYLKNKSGMFVKPIIKEFRMNNPRLFRLFRKKN